MGRKMLRDKYAGTILDVLIARNGALIKKPELAEETGLTGSQIEIGVQYLRDQLAKIESVIFVSERGRNGGIAITGDVYRAERYTRKQAHTARVQLNRVIDGTVQQMLVHADPVHLRDIEMIEVQLNRIVEDLERVEKG